MPVKHQLLHMTVLQNANEVFLKAVNVSVTCTTLFCNSIYMKKLRLKGAVLEDGVSWSGQLITTLVEGKAPTALAPVFPAAYAAPALVPERFSTRWSNPLTCQNSLLNRVHKFISWKKGWRMAGSNAKEGAELRGEGTGLQKHPFGSSKPSHWLVLAAEVQLTEDWLIAHLCLKQRFGPFPPCN